MDGRTCTHSKRPRNQSWIRSVGVPPPLEPCVGRRDAWRMRGKARWGGTSIASDDNHRESQSTLLIQVTTLVTLVTLVAMGNEAKRSTGVNLLKSKFSAFPEFLTRWFLDKMPDLGVDVVRQPFRRGWIQKWSITWQQSVALMPHTKFDSNRTCTREKFWYPLRN